MSSHEEWCSDRVSRLLQEELRISTLAEMKEYLSTIPEAEISRIASVLDFPMLFDCLDDTQKEQVDLACEVLTLCMGNLTLGESTTRYSALLEGALKHPYAPVKSMALTEIERNVSEDEPINDFCRQISLLISVIDCIGSEDISIAIKAINIVRTVALTEIGLMTITSEILVRKLKEVMSINEIVRLRVYEMLIKIANESRKHFKDVQSTGIMSQILEELNGTDVLAKMNIIELLSKLAETNPGYVYLQENRIFSKIFSLIEDNDDPLMVSLCEPGILRFFGNIARRRPKELMGVLPKFLDKLFTNIECGDLTIVGVTLDTLGVIGMSNEGKKALNKTGNQICYAIKTIVKLLTSFPTAVRIRALNCLENLLRVETKEASMCQMSRQWYRLFGDRPMEIILRYAKNPFSELKLAGLGILDAIAEMQWGQEEIKNTPGLVEFLLDRNMEGIKECKEMKYQIVKALSTSRVFDNETMAKIQSFVAEGPFYVQGVTEITFDGQ